MFEIFYAKSVGKDIKSIPTENLKKIKKEIEYLIEFPNVKNVKKLTHHPVSDFRLKVGNYRVLFDIDAANKAIYILKIGHRKEVY